MVFNGRQSTNATRLLVFNNAKPQTLTFSGTIPAVTDTTTNPFRIGTRGATRYFPGRIDDVRLYNRALSAAEIRQSYQGASPLVPLNRPYFNSPTAPPAANTTNFFRFFR